MANATDTRQRLLDSARDIYLQDGLAGLSMRKVAQAAGVSAPAIYRHFDSKEALLTAICSEGFQMFARSLWQGLEGTTPRDRLRRTGLGYLRFGIEHASYYRVIFMSPVEDLGFGQMPKNAQEKISPTFQFLVDRVRECMAAGILPPRDPVELATTIWAHCHGLVSLYLSGHLSLHDRASFEAFYARSIDWVVDGLSAGAAGA